MILGPMLSSRPVRTTTAGLLTAGLLLAASNARAGEAAAGAQVDASARVTAVPAPDPDASSSTLEEYFADLRQEIAGVRERLRAAHTEGDDEAEATLQADLDAKLQFFEDERKRLDIGRLDTSFDDNRAMAIAGIVLLVVGGASALTSLGFALGYGLTDLDGDANEDLAWTSLGLAGVSLGTIIPGAILYSVSGSPAVAGVRVAPYVAFGSGSVAPGLVLNGSF